MTTIYLYLLNTLADWEIGHLTAELHSQRFFRQGAPACTLKTVSDTKEPIKTMGGLTILPDCLVEDIIIQKENVIILPGADTWNELRHAAIINKVSELLAVGGTVAAICGATTALAKAGLLDNRPHTSNGAGFLEMMCPSYQGTSFYLNQLSVANHNLITAGSTGGLLWAKQIIERLDVFYKETLTAWSNYFETGQPEHFYALMQTLPAHIS